VEITRSIIPAVLIFSVYVCPVAAYDEEEAMALAEKSKCFRCHGVDKKKEGAAYRDIAARYAEKYKGKPYAEAEARAIEHITSGEMVKFDDGHEEKHKKVKSDDIEEIKNLVGWILSLPGGTYKPE
jgi:cytochrome c